jgi:aminopeptidase-like protein
MALNKCNGDRKKQKNTKCCTLKVGEVVVNGQRDESFILCANLCHSSVDDNCLAGVAAGLEIVHKLLKRPKLRYTYRFLILPSAIGAAAYMSCNGNLLSKMKAGLFLGGLGARGPHCLHLSYEGNTPIDRYAKLIVGKSDQTGQVGGFRESVSSIASVFNRPDIAVPMLVLSRILPSDPDELNVRFGSLDNYDFQNITRSGDLVLEIIGAIEKDRAFEPRL